MPLTYTYKRNLFLGMVPPQAQYFVSFLSVSLFQETIFERFYFSFSSKIDCCSANENFLQKLHPNIKKKEV